MEVSPCLVIPIMSLLLTFSCTSCSSMDSSISYEEYCDDISEDAGHHYDTSSANHLGFRRAVSAGGSPLFSTDVTGFSLRRSGRSAYFSTLALKLEEEQGKQRIVVEASLLLRNHSFLWSGSIFNRTRVFRQRGARRDPSFRQGGMRLTFKGLWIPHSGTLCMAGCFMQNSLSQTSNGSDCKVKALFRYPLENVVNQPLVKGIISSKRDLSDSRFFNPIYITGIYEAPYVFTKDDEATDIGVMVHAYVPQGINVWKDDTAVCQFPWYKQPLNVAWDKQCTGQDCSPFKIVGPNTTTTLMIENMVCSGGKVHGLFIFTHSQFQLEHLFQSASDVFSVEGVWNASTGQLSALACYLEGVTNSSLLFDSRDCDLSISLQFPTTLALTFRYSVIGQVVRKAGSTLTPFKPFLFTGHMDITYGSIGWGRSPLKLEYAYTPETITQAGSQCQASGLGGSKRSKIGRRKLKYPDGQTFVDLGFQAIMKDSLGLTSEAYFSPVSVDKRTNLYFNPSLGVVTGVVVSNKKSSLNVSFDINFYVHGDSFKPIINTTSHRFSAEGVYKPKTGLLCLIACRPLAFSKVQNASKLYDGDKDCEMHITVQYPPTNPGYLDKPQISGRIISSRVPKDILFFSPVTITSGAIFYQEQAANSLVQIDFEIIMGIISLTMAVLFIGLQLRHVKNNPKVLPQISLLTLLVLTLGHLIPLVLNFEAIFSSRSRQSILQWSGGWLEINEVIVRLMTMVVFLMLVRLLHRTWVSKSELAGSEGPWHMEKGPFRVCLITYGLAGLIAAIVYGVKGSNFLDVLKGFAGLAIDFFLFPQVVGNYVWEVQGTVLSSSFYMGMTFVRTLPHVYDVVRKLEFFAIRDRRYYYANPTWDFYSNAWDVVIPCGGMLFAVLVFCQQRYGGAFFSLASWRQRRSYNQISMNPI
ncbi:hypothetical protein GOP47_0007942 [Adiantum capillus-veneris]|uniref:RING-type E3 ubiquitin transferase n=1 Tax=Adiantum capillus-veneris TaxID=13818 RepID=A0A9D4V1V7_ADICA|nr:hypothetical protein GOP47_0007942 [Adiantum capillus-veneris]